MDGAAMLSLQGREITAVHVGSEHTLAAQARDYLSSGGARARIPRRQCHGERAILMNGNLRVRGQSCSNAPMIPSRRLTGSHPG